MKSISAPSEISLVSIRQRKVIRYLETRVAIADNPESFGKALTGPLAGLWRYRVDDHRIVCRIQRERITVLVLAAGHRKEIYDRTVRLPP